jgi:hypothetical protein
VALSLSSFASFASFAFFAFFAAFLSADCASTAGLGGGVRPPEAGAEAASIEAGGTDGAPTDASNAPDAPKTGAARVLASGLLTPIAVALTPTQVIVGTRGDAAVSLVDKAGSAPVLLDSLRRAGQGAMDIIVDGDVVYWTGVGATDCCGRLTRSVLPASPGPAAQSNQTGVELGGQYFALAQDPSFVYTASSNAQSEAFIRVWRKSDSTPLAVRGVGVGGPIAVDSTDVYFVLPPDQIRRFAKGALEGDAGTGDPFANTSAVPAGMAIDDDYVYWTLDLSGTIVRQPKAAPSTTPATITSGPGSPARLALYGGFVYWTDPGSRSIRRAPVAGGNVETIASDQDSPSAIAVDDSGVYWTSLNAGTLSTAPFGP